LNKQTGKVILQDFCERRGIRLTVLSPGLTDMICAAAAPYFLVIESLDHLKSEDPAAGLLAKLIDRTYGTVAGSLALVCLGHLREAEILSRSVLESSATICYIVNETPPVRLAAFFYAYVREERHQNRKWASELQSLPSETQHDHRTRIDRKNESLDRYDNFIDAYVQHFGLSVEKAKVWPGLIERMTELGRRIDYRTVYAAMCSQAHHDAEDILNHFRVNSLDGLDHMAGRMEREADTFSIFMMVFGLKWFVEATCAVCQWLGLSAAITEGRLSIARIEQELTMVSAHLDSANFPENWGLRRIRRPD
jgi:hypothetical protein